LPGNTYNRYVTWGIQVPEGVAVPSLDQWRIPVWFPNADTFFPKNVVPMYAIRNPSESQTYTTTGEMVPAPAGVWFIWTPGSGYGLVEDAYFYGGTPDTSEGSQYPPEADRDIDPNPPPWVGDPTPPGETPEQPVEPSTEQSIDSTETEEPTT